jgi:hypothetical protein
LGGTLGFTGVYGVSDATITRRRVEADLAVFREYQERYRGMKEACLQQLDWGVERYAKLPQPPQFFTLQNVPPIVTGESIFAVVSCLVGLAVLWLIYYPFHWFLTATRFPIPIPSTDAMQVILFLIALGFGVFMMAPEFIAHNTASKANGDMPQENARRQKAYEDAVAAALRVADPLKAAQDHRLRCQIRELESLATALGEKEVKVRGLLATL